MVPPLVGVAVNVTDEPAHIAVWLALIDTDGVTLVDVIPIAVLVAVAVVTQVALLVIVTVTWSPLLSVVDVKVTPVAPAIGVPFTDHW